MRNWKRFLLATACAAPTMAATLTINPAQKSQEVLGFGGGIVYYQGWVTAMSESMQKDLYDTAFSGLNLSMLRLGNWLQEEDVSKIKDDVKIVKEAKNRLGNHLKIEMSSWTAPATLKGSGKINGNEGANKSANSLKKSDSDPYGKYVYNDFANWWKSSYLKYRDAGINVDYISLQNEPDMNADYEETLFDPTENDSIAGYAQALTAVRAAFNGVSNAPKIIGPEPLGIGYNNFQNYMNALDESKLDAYAYHLYHAGDGNDNSLNNYKNPENFKKPMSAIASKYGNGSKPIIMTEFCTMAENGKEDYMVGLAHIMQVGFTSGKLNAYIAWELMWGEGKGQLIGVCAKGWGNCEEDKIVISPEYHAVRHYSKFVNPGWKVISAAADDADLKTVAFANPAGDSISIIVINTGDKSIQLTNPEISGMGLVNAVQSKENGFKSKSISKLSCTILPARSITSLVYVKGSFVLPTEMCKDETTDPNYVEPTAADTLVIVDYSKTNSADGWSAEKTLTAPTYETKTIDGVSSYVKVNLAGCDQSDESCGYQHAFYKLTSEQAETFAKCSELSITMHSADDTTAYINVGGAGGSEWVDYKYGVQAGSTSWVTSSISLEKEASTGSNQLKFNSNASGFYVSKIVATGCASSAIPLQKNFRKAANGISKIYDVHGRLMWTGKLSEAELSGKELHLQNLPAGIYLIRNGAKTISAIKR